MRSIFREGEEPQYGFELKNLEMMCTDNRIIILSKNNQEDFSFQQIERISFSEINDNIFSGIMFVLFGLVAFLSTGLRPTIIAVGIGLIVIGIGYLITKMGKIEIYISGVSKPFKYKLMGRDLRFVQKFIDEFIHQRG